jgi:hypothetical protein
MNCKDGKSFDIYSEGQVFGNEEEHCSGVKRAS